MGSGPEGTAAALDVDPFAGPPLPPTRWQRIGTLFLVAFLPGALVVYFAFNRGGFFPGSVGVAAAVLAGILTLRVMLADQPFAGLGWAAGVTGAALAAFAGWVLASGSWSHAPARALTEFDRALMYLLVFVLFVSLARTSDNLRWMLRSLAAGMFIVAMTALATRLMPDVFPIAKNLAENRLSYPLTYWNTLGILVSSGLIICLHLTCSLREPVGIRAAAAAALPVFATALLFTFSRGAIGAAVLGVVVYLCSGRARATLTGLVAALPVCAVAVKVAYDADRLASQHPTSAAAVKQGHHVALVLIGCIAVALTVRLALALRVDHQLRPIRVMPRDPRSRRVAYAGLAATTVLLLGVAGAPDYLSRQYDHFLHDSAPVHADLRDRLTDVSNDSRIRQWRIAIDDFEEAPIRGGGAGTYGLAWDQRRIDTSSVVDAHSLYIEQLGELGLIGFLLLVGVIGGMLVAFIVRRRAGPRSLYAAAFATGIAIALHAALDWDWEMPATMVPLFSLGATALAVAPSRRAEEPSPAWRLTVAIGLMATAITPALIAVSDSRINAAHAAFDRGNCRDANDQALSAISVVAVRPESYQLLGECDMRLGYYRLAILALRQAIKHDPEYWHYHYELAIAQAAAGEDPHPEIRRARELNPRDRSPAELAKEFPIDQREKWAAKGRLLAAVVDPQ